MDPGLPHFQDVSFCCRIASTSHRYTISRFEVQGVRDGRGCAKSVVVYSFDFKSGGVGSAGMETRALFPAQLLLARTLSALTVLVVAHWSHSVCLYRHRVMGCCQFWSACLATCRILPPLVSHVAMLSDFSTVLWRVVIFC